MSRVCHSNLDVWVRINRDVYGRDGWLVRRYPERGGWVVLDRAGSPGPTIYPTLAAAKAVVNAALGAPEVTDAQRYGLAALARGARPSPAVLAALERVGLAETYRHVRPGRTYESTGVRLTTRGRELAAQLADRRRTR